MLSVFSVLYQLPTLYFEMLILGMRPFFSAVLLVLAVLSTKTAQAVELLRGELSHSSFEIALEQNGFKAGEQHWLAVSFTPQEGWHTYWKNPGDSGAAPYIGWSTPEGVTIGEALFSSPTQLPVGPLMNYGYHGVSTILFPLTVSDGYTKNTIPLEAIAEWLVCDVECVPQIDTWQINIPRNTSSEEAYSSEIFIDARAALPESSYWEANLTISNSTSDLLVFAEQADLPNIETAYYFPETEGILSYAASQQWSWTEHGLKLVFERSAGAPQPDHAYGLLKVRLQDGTESTYELEPSLTLNIRSINSATENAEVFSMPVWQAGIFALLGGLILNLMPCVFPVLSLKAFALISANYKTQANRKKEGWAYTLGIWVSFMAIVGVLVSLRAGGAAIGWGFQLQEPLFIGFLVLLMVLVSLSLAGVFNIRLGNIEGAGQSFTLREGSSGAFAKGVLATLVATPCTAPLMAPAIGYALTQPLPVVFFVFSLLALGLALPFLLLSYSDRLAGLMPKPGIWMEKVKQGLAFPMLLTAAWLIYVYDLQAGSQATLFLLVSVIVMSFGVWLFQQTNHVFGRLISVASIVASLALAQAVSHTAEQPTEATTASNELPYSDAQLERLLSEGQPVFAYFTAEWCITCKVNEQVALFTSEVQEELAQRNITIVKGDWTNRNAEIASVLAKYGRAGVPLYLYYPKGADRATVLPEILTKDIVLEYLRAS